MFQLSTLPESLPRNIDLSGLGVEMGTSSWSVSCLLGEGAAGFVVRLSRPSEFPLAGKVLFPIRRIVGTSEGLDAVHARFLSEGRRGRKLEHQNLIQNLGVGNLVSRDSTLHGSPVILMEHVGGADLGKTFEHTPPPDFLRRLEIALQIASAVSYLHGEGICHRDIKPGNIMVSTGGSVKLGDVGVASWGAFHPEYSDGIPTKSGTVLTTWDYVAPEVSVRPSAYDVGSDIWSLGKTLLEVFQWRVLPRDVVIDSVQRNQLVGAAEGVSGLIGDMMHFDPESRPSAAEIERKFSQYAETARESAVIANDARRIELAARACDRFVSRNPRLQWRPDDFRKQLTDLHLPESYGGGYSDDPCSICDSPFKVRVATSSIALPYESRPVALLVCMGSAHHICGYVWEEDDDFYVTGT